MKSEDWSRKNLTAGQDMQVRLRKAVQQEVERELWVWELEGKEKQGHLTQEALLAAVELLTVETASALW